MLGIDKPIVFCLSFGGCVAQAYATRHPQHPGKLILASTAAHMDFEAVFAAFEHLEWPRGCGDRARAMETADTDVAGGLSAALRAVASAAFSVPRVSLVQMVNEAVATHFSGDGGELARMDFRPVLHRIRCPVLVLAGERDPITPIAFSEALVACLPKELARFERFSDCGHGVHVTSPERFFQSHTRLHGESGLIHRSR